MKKIGRNSDIFQNTRCVCSFLGPITCCKGFGPQTKLHNPELNWTWTRKSWWISGRGHLSRGHIWISSLLGSTHRINFESHSVCTFILHTIWFSLPYCTSGNGPFYFKKLSVLYGFIRSTMADSEKRQHTTREEEEEEDDPVIRAIQKTGCLELHYALQECMAEKQDWRKCQDSMLNFKNCMNAYARKTARQEQWRLCSLDFFSHFFFSSSG